MMSIDSIACLVATLALLSLAISSQGHYESGAAALHDYQLANDAAEVLYKSGSLEEFAEYSQGNSTASPNAQEDIQKISVLSGRCVMLSSGRNISTCEPAYPKSTAMRLVPYSSGIAKIAITIGQPSN